MFPDRVSRMDGAVLSFFTSQYCCPALIHRGYGKGFVLFSSFHDISPYVFLQIHFLQDAKSTRGSCAPDH